MQPLSNQLLSVFHDVLDGTELGEAARRVGWTRLQARREVCELARNLQQYVGVEGIDEDVHPSEELLHRHRDDYREALSHYVPECVVPRHQSAAPGPAELEAILAATNDRRCRDREQALVLMLFATAATPDEIARLEVRDYLNPDGTVRTVSEIRAEIAENGQARALYLVNRRMQSAIDSYLGQRLALKQQIGQPELYRGLAPMSQLFLRQDGKPFGADGQGSRLDLLYHQLFRQAGLKGIGASAVRRTTVLKLARRGYDDPLIGKVLGVSADEARTLRNPLLAPLEQAMLELF